MGFERRIRQSELTCVTPGCKIEDSGDAKVDVELYTMLLRFKTRYMSGDSTTNYSDYTLYMNRLSNII